MLLGAMGNDPLKIIIGILLCRNVHKHVSATADLELTCTGLVRVDLENSACSAHCYGTKYLR